MNLIACEKKKSIEEKRSNCIGRNGKMEKNKEKRKIPLRHSPLALSPVAAHKLQSEAPASSLPTAAAGDVAQIDEGTDMRIGPSSMEMMVRAIGEAVIKSLLLALPLPLPPLHLHLLFISTKYSYANAHSFPFLISLLHCIIGLLP